MEREYHTKAVKAGHNFDPREMVCVNCGWKVSSIALEGFPRCEKNKPDNPPKKTEENQ